MDDVLLLGTLNKAELAKDTKDKLEKLCQDIYNTSFKNLTDEQVTDLLNMELNTSIDTLTVFCQATRQVEEFSPNVYSISQVIDLKASYKSIKAQLASIPDPNRKLEKYLELKMIFYRMLAFKYQTTEEFLRNLIRESEVKDGIKPMGRFTK